jgi:membrane fusion protein (multidrug efflux system)
MRQGMTAQASPLAPTAVAEKAKTTSRTKIVLPALVAVFALAGGGWYALSAGKQSTDDAQVEGHVMNVSARVSGQVAKVYVEDNQEVKEGDLLLELDHAELDAKVDAARADLTAAQAQLANAQAALDLTTKNADAALVQARGGLAQASSTADTQAAAIRQADADVAAAASRLSLARTELDRAKNLFASDALPRATVDARQADFDTATAQAQEASARLASAHAAVSGVNGGIVTARGRLAAAQTVDEQLAAARSAVELARAKVKQAEAQLALAQLSASYAYVRAPHAGEVSRRTVEVGQMVGPDKALLSLVPLDDVWVVANFKEDQLAEMHPGETATVTIDAYGSKRFEAHVESIAGASGARFALLPPDNASGNFVKVVQRVPVLVRLEGAQGAALRPGMSANVTVKTRG